MLQVNTQSNSQALARLFQDCSMVTSRYSHHARISAITKSDLIPLSDLSRWEDGEKQSIMKAIGDVIESGVFIDGPKNGVLSEQLQDLLSC